MDTLAIMFEELSFNSYPALQTQLRKALLLVFGSLRAKSIFASFFNDQTTVSGSGDCVNLKGLLINNHICDGFSLFTAFVVLSRKI